MIAINLLLFEIIPIIIIIPLILHNNVVHYNCLFRATKMCTSWQLKHMIGSMTLSYLSDML